MGLPKADLEVMVTVDASRMGRKSKNSMSRLTNAVKNMSNGVRNSKSFKVVKAHEAAALKSGENDINAALADITRATQGGLQEVLVSMKVLAQSLAPKDSGRLRKSAFAVTEKIGGKVRGKVGFNIISGAVPAGVETGVDYAVFVHEDDSAFHKSPTQSGFLLEAVQRRQSSIAFDLQQAINKRRKKK